MRIVFYEMHYKIILNQMKKNPKNRNTSSSENSKQSSRVSQSDIPSCSLDKALTIAKAIFDNYAGKGATPLQVAKALEVQPTTGPFRMLCGASIAYGLTSGGYNSTDIIPEDLAKKILRPTVEGEDRLAKINAFLKPRIINEFFTKYDGSAIPREDIAKNVLSDMGVPSDRLNAVFEFMLSQGKTLGIIFDLKSKDYIDLKARDITDNKLKEEENLLDENKPVVENDPDTMLDNVPEINKIPFNKEGLDRLKKVFITHGKNTKFIEPIRKLLSFGELTAVVSVERTTTSQPVPDKVMNDMRSCGAAIIHVEDELKLIDDKATEYKIINSNVLIEIGAALALYGRRFILLVKEGINLPSNLQGLFEVRYSGDALDGNATIKLMEAINDIKNQSLPN